jgi:hypothetical protein
MRMLSFLLSTIAFFVSAYYVKRFLENQGIPKGMTRGVLVFSISLLIAYLVAFGVDRLTS